MASFLLSHLSAHLRYVSSAYFFTSSKSKGVDTSSSPSVQLLSLLYPSFLSHLLELCIHLLPSQLHHLSPHFSLLLPSSLYYRVCRLKESHLVLIFCLTLLTLSSFPEFAFIFSQSIHGSSTIPPNCFNHNS